jgi:ubiquinone/menaquinone biosynthesis C-methylase UbiE
VGIQFLAGLVSSGRVVGVDYSEAMVEQASVRNADAISSGRVELRRGSVGSLPFDNDTFDKALAINSMQVWPDIAAGPRETWRVVKPGGRVVFGFTRHSGQPKDGLAEMLTAPGFAVTQIVDIDRDFCALAIKPD